ncbi:16S rRNA (guanine(966)-N(2))-methyltransferase RsmD [Glaciecola punicea]|jgi:16S rRNA (guanine966-N2)-methyltransferase|nr:16S rRNA (guanine(966)-N(2))-methyltransferase RsmD [Glaciecola punicea]OFA32678.1 16S rRNA (guanine(966)-N(2))-methyltransferase RsmD [Glaciecola punicea]
MSPTHKCRKPSSGANRAKNVKMSRGLVRIIAGEHRGRRLPVLVHEGLRPTGDRVKETLFNWLMSSINQATCLDMFAGSGSLGIEALSRGAAHIVFIENDRVVAQQISDNLATLRETDKADVVNASALSHEFTSAAIKQFDIVFIDPPFGKEMVANSIDRLVSENMLAQNAYVYIETSHNDSYDLPAQFCLLKELKTSQVNARLYQLAAN